MSIKRIGGRISQWRAGKVAWYAFWHSISGKIYESTHENIHDGFLFHSLEENIRFRMINKFRKKNKKKIKIFKAEVEQEQRENVTERNNIIWIMWWQGMENAPEIVKMCYESVVRNFGEKYQIVLLNKDNYQDYVQLPKDIVNKLESGKCYLEKGKIALAQISDLIRLELMIKYGGIWMDATIFCSSNKLPAHIEDSNLFVYQVLFPNAWVSSITTENWFFIAKPNQKVLRMQQKLMYDYIRTHKIFADYLLFYIFMEISKEIYQEDFQDMMPVPNANALSLQNYLFKPFNQKIYDVILENSPLHKLTWKFSEEDANKEGTFYQYLLNNTKLLNEADQ